MPTDFTKLVILSFMARRGGLCGSFRNTKQGTRVFLLVRSNSVKSIRSVRLSKSISLAQWSQLLLELPSLLVILMSTFFNGIGQEQNMNACTCRIDAVFVCISKSKNNSPATTWLCGIFSRKSGSPDRARGLRRP